MRNAFTAIALACIVLACGIDAEVLADAADRSDGGSVALPDLLSDAGQPTPITTLDVFTGTDFSCALVKGAALCWGKNTLGSLGTGDTASHITPTPVAGGFTFDTLALGSNHACGLEHGSGRVLCWGDGSRGQLGQGDIVARSSPVAVPLPGVVVELSVGFDHACATLAGGALYCWGSNGEGELGQGVNGDRPSPVRVGDDSDWMTVAAGQGHTCGVRRPGNLWCWGRNTSGQLGIGGPPAPGEEQRRIPMAAGIRTDWKRIDLGQDQGCGLVNDGSLHCWGAGDNGGLGPELRAYYVPTQVGSRVDWEKISLDTFSTCGITRSAQLFCWGRNAEGQLGLGGVDDRYEPAEVGAGIAWATVSVGRFHTCATTVDRTIRCAGANNHGQLGTGDRDRRNTLTVVSLPADVAPGRVP